MRRDGPGRKSSVRAGIEPCRRHAANPNVSAFRHGLKPLVPHPAAVRLKCAALAVVQWIERPPPKRQIQVRFLSAGPKITLQGSVKGLWPPHFVEGRRLLPSQNFQLLLLPPRHQRMNLGPGRHRKERPGGTKKMKRRMVRLAHDISFALGFALRRARAVRHPRVLMYHAIGEGGVPADAFRAQLDFIPADVAAFRLNRSTRDWHRDAHADRSRVVTLSQPSARRSCATNYDSGDFPGRASPHAG